jgi:hypothetical protein
MLKARSFFLRLHIVLLLALFATGIHAQQRPLITEDVDIIPPGSMRIQAGIDFLQDAKFPASGLTGDLTRVGVLGINIGLSPNVEFQISGVAQNVLSINSQVVPAPIQVSFPPGTNSTNDIGDFSLATKIKIRNESGKWPSFGFRFGVELPNSNQARGIGLNQTNAFGSVLFGKKFGKKYGNSARFNTFGNVGIAILTAPTKLFTQNDVFTYGFAGVYRASNRVNIVGEISGRQNTRPGTGPVGTESQSQARLGMQIKATGLQFDVAGIAGLNKFSPRSGVTFGVTYDSPSIFTPAK